jgi:hypothetical protein
MSNLDACISREAPTELFTAMRDEIGLFSGFALLLTDLSSAVRQKDWPRLEAIVTKLEETGPIIVSAEKKRDSEYIRFKKVIKVPENTRLIELLPMLDPRSRNELSLLTKNLRGEVLKIKIASRGLSYYLESVSHLLKSIFEELYPYTRGKIYSRSGKENKNSDGAIMINKEL